MKRYFYSYITLAVLALAIGVSCTKDPITETEQPTMSITVQTRLQGDNPSINTDPEDRVTKIRMISAESTHLENISSDPAQGLNQDGLVTFPIKYFTGQQHFFFVANEREDLSTLTPETFNRKEFNAADYMEPPFLMTAVLKNVYVETVSGTTQLNSSTVQLERVFARLKYEIDATGVAGAQNMTITSIKIINIPSRFTLGGMITQYPQTTTQGYFEKELLNAPVPLSANHSGYVYLPEHHPKDKTERTKAAITIDNETYYVDIKEPYSSVNDGKIVRNGNYVMNFKLREFLP